MWTLIWSFKCTTPVTLTHRIRIFFLLRVLSFGHEEQSSLGMVRYSLLFLSHVYRLQESFVFLPPVVAIPLIPLAGERESPDLPFPLPPYPLLFPLFLAHFPLPKRGKFHPSAPPLVPFITIFSFCGRIPVPGFLHFPNSALRFRFSPRGGL